MRSLSGREKKNHFCKIENAPFLCKYLCVMCENILVIFQIKNSTFKNDEIATILKN